jgi:hypothetical protein
VSYKFNPFTGTLDDVGPNNGNGVPGGSDTQVQFNDGGVFGGDVDLTWNKTSNLLTVGGDINLNDGGSFTTTLQTITPTANRTISLPDATGTVALVAGSSGQLLYNNAGVNAGVSGSAIGATGDITLSLNGAASTPPLDVTGTWFTGGTATTTKPQVLIEPTGATSTAWSTSGTGLGVNAASGFSGNLLDLQVNGTSQAKISSAGLLTSSRLITTNGGGASTTSIGFLDGSGSHGFYFGSGTELYISTASTYRGRFGSGIFSVPGGTQLGFESGGAASSLDVAFTRSAAGVVKVTNGSSGDGTISGQLRSVGTAPATASSTGTAGDVRYDASFVYICTATNTWKRAALTTW